MAAIGLKFGGWVAGTRWTRTVHHIGGQTHKGCMLEEGVARAVVHHPSPISCYISEKAGSIEYEVDFLPSLYRDTAKI